MGRKAQRSCLVFRLGFTPSSRWRDTSGFFIDIYRYNDSYKDEAGIGVRILWLIFAVGINRD